MRASRFYNIIILLSKQEESLAELKRLYLKGLLSFKTVLFVRETFTENLEYRQIRQRLKRRPKVIKINTLTVCYEKQKRPIQN